MHRLGIVERGRVTILVALMALWLPTGSEAQYFYGYGIVQQAGGDETVGLGVPLVVKTSTLGGIEAGLNLERVNLALDFLFGSTDLTMEGATLETKLFFVDVNLDFVALKRPISPFVTAGIGSVNFSDSHVGPELFNETDFSYNVGAGLCAAYKRHFLAKALYRATWTTMKETDRAIRFDGLSFGLGYAF
ncbi:porin family protein [Candidatus Fermentibacteria bacterium]|nr:porin family protein [Candidatus Fermentibacteria bacterium]